MEQWTDLEANEKMIIKENNFRKAIKTRMLETQREKFMTPSHGFDFKGGEEMLADSTAFPQHVNMHQTNKSTADMTNLGRPHTN